MYKQMHVVGCIFRSSKNGKATIDMWDLSVYNGWARGMMIDHDCNRKHNSFPISHH